MLPNFSQFPSKSNAKTSEFKRDESTQFYLVSRLFQSGTMGAWDENCRVPARAFQFRHELTWSSPTTPGKRTSEDEPMERGTRVALDCCFVSLVCFFCLPSLGSNGRQWTSLIGGAHSSAGQYRLWLVMDCSTHARHGELNTNKQQACPFVTNEWYRVSFFILPTR